jgi:hypothetical protein
MIGRGADVNELVTQLENGVHRIVAAPRRTGKSSACRAAVAELSVFVAYPSGSDERMSLSMFPS